MCLFGEKQTSKSHKPRLPEAGQCIAQTAPCFTPFHLPEQAVLPAPPLAGQLHVSICSTHFAPCGPHSPRSGPYPGIKCGLVLFWADRVIVKSRVGKLKAAAWISNSEPSTAHRIEGGEDHRHGPALGWWTAIRDFGLFGNPQQQRHHHKHSGRAGGKG